MDNKKAQLKIGKATAFTIKARGKPRSRWLNKLKKDMRKLDIQATAKERVVSRDRVYCKFRKNSGQPREISLKENSINLIQISRSSALY